MNSASISYLYIQYTQRFGKYNSFRNWNWENEYEVANFEHHLSHTSDAYVSSKSIVDPANLVGSCDSICLHLLLVATIFKHSIPTSVVNW